jgi:hypothetical protein
LQSGEVVNDVMVTLPNTDGYFDNFRFNAADSNMYGLFRQVSFDPLTGFFSGDIRLATCDLSNGMVNLISSNSIAVVVFLHSGHCHHTPSGVSSFSSVEVSIPFLLRLNQLVLSGELNDVGSALRVNVPKSYRTGIEIEGSALIFDQIKKYFGRFSHELRLIGNLALSKNIIENGNQNLNDKI